MSLSHWEVSSVLGSSEVGQLAWEGNGHGCGHGDLHSWFWALSWQPTILMSPLQSLQQVITPSSPQQRDNIPSTLPDKCLMLKMPQHHALTHEDCQMNDCSLVTVTRVASSTLSLPSSPKGNMKGTLGSKATCHGSTQNHIGQGDLWWAAWALPGNSSEMPQL